MAVLNRTLDNSEQYKVLGAVLTNSSAGITYTVAHVPWPATVVAAQAAATGLSGAPTGGLYIQRFIVGTGFTSIPLGSSFALRAFGTSGVVATGVSVPTSALLPEDVIVYQATGSNTAAMNLSLQIVVQPTQDIRKYFNGIA